MKYIKLFNLLNKSSAIRVVIALAILLASLGTSVANIALPILVKEFSVTFSEVQGVVIAYLATLTLTAVTAGHLGDKYGLKFMFVMALGVFTLSLSLCALATNLWFLIGVRAFQGGAAAFLVSLGTALMRRSCDQNRVGRGMGVLGSVAALGTALGPLLGGVLITRAGWESIFWIQIPFAILACAFAIKFLPADLKTKEKKSIPFISVLNWGLSMHLFINVLVAATMMATLVVGPFFLSIGLGLNMLQVGCAMALGPVISVLTGIPSGRFVDKWGSRCAIIAGLGILTIGSIFLAFLPSWIGLTGYIFSIIIITPGYQLFQSANNTAVLLDTKQYLQGTISGLLNFSRNIGLIFGTFVLGWLFTLGVGTEDITYATSIAIAAGMKLTFLCAGAMMIVAMAVIAARVTRIKK